MSNAPKTGEPAADGVSIMLRSWSDGDQDARAKLTPIVHRGFHGLALRYAVSAQWMRRILVERALS